MFARYHGLIALIALLLVTLSVPAGATVYYISPAGNDVNPGTQALPWRTLQKAADTMVAGDTALIANGEYPGGIKHRTSGTAARPITYRAINPRGAVIQGSQTATTEVIWIYRADYIVLDGLTVRDGMYTGIRIDNSNSVTVKRSAVFESGISGIFSAYSDDTTLIDNECAYSREQHGIYLSNSGDRPVVRGNMCHSNGRAGIQLNGDPKFILPLLGTRGDGVIDGGEIVGNICYGNGITNQAAAMNFASVRNTLIANNLLYNNLAGGMSFWNDHNPTATQWGCKNNRIVNNTIFFRPGDGRWCLVFKHGSTGNIVLNNILFGGARGAYEIDDSSQISADYNFLPSWGDTNVTYLLDSQTYLDFAAWQAKTGNDTRSSTADPMFVSALVEPFDFHLAPGSPAIDSGVAAEDVPEDIIGTPRSATDGRDVGSFEELPIGELFEITGQVTYEGVGVRRTRIVVGGKAVSTREDGTYTVSGLSAGTYNMTATHRYFSINPPAQTVTVGPSKTINFTSSRGLSAFSVTPGRVLGGNRVTGSVEVMNPAPEGGLLLELSTTDPALEVPETVTIPTGATKATFPVIAYPVPESRSGLVCVSIGELRYTRPVTINPPGISLLRLLPAGIVGGSVSTGTVRIQAPAPAGGWTVTLSTDSPFARAPVEVVVPEGASEATFEVVIDPVASDRTVTVTASCAVNSRTAPLRILAPSLKSFAVSPAQSPGGQTVEGRVTLTGRAPSQGVVVSISCNASTGVTYPVEVTVSEGETSAPVPITLDPVDADTAKIFTVKVGKVSKSGTLKVLAPVVSALALDPIEVEGGASATGIAYLNAPAGPGGVTITLKSGSQTVVTVPGNVLVPAGETSATFALTTRKPASPVSVAISATTGKVSRTASIKVN